MYWREDIRFAEDVLFNYELLSSVGAIAVCHKPLLRYRVHAQSTCHKMPEACYLARDNYTKILDSLASNNTPIMSKQKKLIEMFQRKKAFNERFLTAYIAGHCQSYPEFALYAD